MMSFLNVTGVRRCFHAILPLLFIFITTSSRAQLLPGSDSGKEKDKEEEEVATDVLGRTTPRGTVRGFISAVAERDYDLASRYLNLGPDQGKQNGEDLARTLQTLLDRGYLMPYSRISDDPNGNTEEEELSREVDQVGLIAADGENVQVLVERMPQDNGPGIWKFSASTLEQISGVASDNILLIDRILPSFLKDNLWGGAPMGHWLAAILLIVLAYLLAWAVTALAGLFIPRVYKPAGVDPVAGVIKALMLPVRLYLAVWLFVSLSRQIGISIILRQLFSALTIIVGVIAILLLLWRLAEFLGNFSKNRMLNRGNASGMSIVLFLQRAAKITIVIIGVIAILGVFGIDVTAGLAALGIGGIALALGAQKSVENFVGSVTLITDQPVRVGDFCKVGDIVGTVERIGMRSTRIRTLGRTVVTIPNGEFSSAKIENYAHRDRFWFHPILTLRYETTPDQIRFLLVELRAVLYAHPKVSPDPARIRFIEMGSASLNLEVFAYINVPNYDEFLEVQEDLLLRMMDVVNESGTGFAFPSQTIYFARDNGVSEEKTKRAVERVRKWKEEEDLQIPHFDPSRIEQLKDSIPYPPEGSANRKK